MPAITDKRLRHAFVVECEARGINYAPIIDAGMEAFSAAMRRIAASTRTEREAKQERYIAQHIAGLRDLGFSQEFLAREESMLRSGLANNNALEDMMGKIFGGGE